MPDSVITLTAERFRITRLLDRREPQKVQVPVAHFASSQRPYLPHECSFLWCWLNVLVTWYFCVLLAWRLSPLAGDFCLQLDMRDDSPFFLTQPIVSFFSTRLKYLVVIFITITTTKFSSHSVCALYWLFIVCKAVSSVLHMHYF